MSHDMYHDYPSGLVYALNYGAGWTDRRTGVQVRVVGRSSEIMAGVV